jgi:hypothetical protein
VPAAGVPLQPPIRLNRRKVDASDPVVSYAERHRIWERKKKKKKKKKRKNQLPEQTRKENSEEEAHSPQPGLG